jgi:hypothetical protein
MLCYLHYLISKDDGKKSSIIFNELYGKIVNSGLINKLEEIRIITVGDSKKLNFDSSKYYKCKIIHHVDDVYQYEFPTLIKIKEHSQNLSDDTKILYLHLKGVTSNQDKWRDNMISIVIDKHEECIASLDEYDACGWMLSEPYIVDNKTPRHFSGNFWWSNVRHIKKLPDPDINSLFKDYEFLLGGRKEKTKNGYVLKPSRYLAEIWIGLLDIDIDKKHKLKDIK